MFAVTISCGVWEVSQTFHSAFQVRTFSAAMFSRRYARDNHCQLVVLSYSLTFFMASKR